MLLGYFVIGQIISIWKVLGAIWNFLEKLGMKMMDMYKYIQSDS